jgi:hypothetical protein
MTLLLLILVAVPIIAWVAVKWRPGRQDPRPPGSGPKHRWWQP